MNTQFQTQLLCGQGHRLRKVVPPTGDGFRVGLCSEAVNALRRWCNFAQELQVLLGEPNTTLDRCASDIATWLREGVDQPLLDREWDASENDRDCACRSRGCKRGWRSYSVKDLDAFTNKFLNESSKTLGFQVCETMLDNEILTLNPTQFSHHVGGQIPFRSLGVGFQI
jgi:hypothetical protein